MSMASGQIKHQLAMLDLVSVPTAPPASVQLSQSPANAACLQASEIRLHRGEVGHKRSFCNNKLVFPSILPGWHSNHRLSSLAAIGGSQI